MENEVKENQEHEKEEVQLSESENKATELGWVPKDQWEGNPDEWVSAKQFLQRGELFGRINSYKHEVINLKKTVDALVKHNEKVYDAGYKDAIKSLKQEKREALREGDTERVLDIEDRIEELETEHVEKKQEFKQEVQVNTPQMPPSWEPWVQANPWYVNDPEMRGYADGLAQRIVNEAKSVGKDINFDELLLEVGRKARTKFPEKFNGRSGATALNLKGDDEGKSAAKSKREPSIELDETEREIMNTLVRSGVITKEKYIEDLKKVRKQRG